MKKNSNFLDRFYSKEYLKTFSNILVFEKILKNLFSKFISEKMDKEKLIHFFRNINDFKIKRRNRIKNHFKNFMDPDWTKKDKGRTTLAYDDGYGEDWGADIDESIYYHLGSNLYDLTIYDLTNILTYGELIELIFAFKTVSFQKFLYKNYNTWKFKFDTWVVFLTNSLKIRNKLFHGNCIGIKGETADYKRGQKFSFLINCIEKINNECYNLFNIRSHYDESSSERVDGILEK